MNSDQGKQKIVTFSEGSELVPGGVVSAVDRLSACEIRRKVVQNDGLVIPILTVCQTFAGKISPFKIIENTEICTLPPKMSCLRVQQAFL